MNTIICCHRTHYWSLTQTQMKCEQGLKPEAGTILCAFNTGEVWWQATRQTLVTKPYSHWSNRLHTQSQVWIFRHHISGILYYAPRVLSKDTWCLQKLKHYKINKLVYNLSSSHSKVYFEYLYFGSFLLIGLQYVTNDAHTSVQSDFWSWLHHIAQYTGFHKPGNGRSWWG